MQIDIVNDTPVTIELKDGQPSQITGYFTKFFDPSDVSTEYITPSYRLRIAPHALDKVLARGDNVALRFQHNPDFTLGDTSTGLVLSKDTRGGLYSHEYDAEDPSFVSVKKKIDKGLVKGSSFKFVAKTSWQQLNGQKILTVDEVESIEDVGPVLEPAIQATGKPLVLSQDAEKELEALEKLWLATETRKRQLEL